jgi:hypothetical protein
MQECKLLIAPRNKFFIAFVSVYFPAGTARGFARKSSETAKITSCYRGLDLSSANAYNSSGDQQSES